MSDPLSPAPASADPEFYWQTARDSSLTTLAIQLFQIAAKYDGENFDSAKSKIDADYSAITGSVSERNGGKFQTAVQAYQEMGWITLNEGILGITPAGRQAIALLVEVPDFLKAVPAFLVELLSRYQLNNPERPPVRNTAIAEQRAASDLFPYWTIWKVMRACDGLVSGEELRRFVFRIHHADEVDPTIASIFQFRKDKLDGLSRADLDDKYPLELEGAIAEPKYWMGRAGTQIGSSPSLIEKPTSTTYKLVEQYLPLIDSLLDNEPIFKDKLSAETWMSHYGQPVQLSATHPTAVHPSQLEKLDDESDPIAAEVELLLGDGVRSFLLTGPPGTSKSWYARRLAERVVGGNADRVRAIQFHSSYGYEDFIEGFVPTIGPSGGLPQFVLTRKIFAEVAELAESGEFAVLIIDEFSRGDVSRIFGEALTYLEMAYRDKPFSLASGREFSVPKNLVIVATMNPFDRSVSAVDVAMQRRFATIQMMPDEKLLRDILTVGDMQAELVEKVVEFFLTCQSALTHGGLGHAYFSGAVDIPSLERIWRYRLSPLFEQELHFFPETLARVQAAYAQMVAG